MEELRVIFISQHSGCWYLTSMAGFLTAAPSPPLHALPVSISVLLALEIPMAYDETRALRSPLVSPLPETCPGRATPPSREHWTKKR